MKTPSRPSNLSASSRLLKSTFAVAFLPGLLFLLSIQPSHAGSATWNLNPISSDWNTAVNWTPLTVPNGRHDTATFDSSTTTDISPAPGTGSIEVDSIVFNSGASPYTITLRGPADNPLLISGTGIVNNSGVLQNFVSGGGLFIRYIYFLNGATAGNQTAFYNPAAPEFLPESGRTLFFDISDADNCTIVNAGVAGEQGEGGETDFNDGSSAGNATIINQASQVTAIIGGQTDFFQGASAGTATVTNDGGSFAGGAGGHTHFFDDSTAADGTFINHGASTEGANGGETQFFSMAPGAMRH